MASNKDYLGLDRIPSIVLAIIPFTSWILGIYLRFKDGKFLAMIVRIFLGFNIIWILDLFFMIKEGHICRFLK